MIKIKIKQSYIEKNNKIINKNIIYKNIKSKLNKIVYKNENFLKKN